MTFDLFIPSSMLPEVTAAFRAVLPLAVTDLTLETPLAGIKGWDTMAHVAVIAELECRFGVTLERQENEAVQTVGDVVRTFGAKRALRVG